MDELKELNDHHNPHARVEPFGDVTERRQLHAKLQRKDFRCSWRMCLPSLGCSGNRGLKDYCFDSNPPSENQIVGRQPVFEYTSQNEIHCDTHQPEVCISVDAGTDLLIMHLCQGTDGSLFHIQSNEFVQAERKAFSDSFIPSLRDCTDLEH
ncbi:unnamed protein product [Nyctereutes procyonoides]|uniref:(raccoon dog) hypothetical protein n=1 Tax=Nyctereutes procyonoides TaxID=34880 RepID=A0A811YZJ1_NYCPR|nr:unnamed protein product [Nyctereutes procyonoides]CAD7682115.1 unnamed protein product [Nyctereutes procyonoides]